MPMRDLSSVNCMRLLGQTTWMDDDRIPNCLDYYHRLGV